MLINIIELLKDDHQTLIHVMENIEGLLSAKNLTADQANLDNLFQNFKKTYFSHDQAEDQIFYPGLKKFDETYQIVLKSCQAHHMIYIGILELKLMPYHNEKWGPKFLVIKDSILSHIHEEENQFFPKANSLLHKEKLEEMGNALINLRNKK